MSQMSRYDGGPGQGAEAGGFDPQREDAVNPVKVVLDRMQNRWTRAIIVGAVLAVLLAPTAYFLAPVKYVARGYVKVQNRLQTLIADTPETERLDDLGAALSEAALSMRTPRVLESVAAVALGQAAPPEFPPPDARDRESERQIVAGVFERSGERSGELVLGKDLDATPDVRDTKMVILSFESEDPSVPAPVVNMVLDQYFRLYGPNAETTYTQTIQQLKLKKDDVLRRLNSTTVSIVGLLAESPYGTEDVRPVIDGQVKRLQELDQKLGTARADKERLEKRFAVGGREGPPPDDMALEPNDSEVESDPEVVAARANLDRLEAEEEGLARRYPPNHSARRLHLSRLENAREMYGVTRSAAASRMRTQFGGDGTYGAVKARIAEFEAQRAGIRGEIDRLNEIARRFDALKREKESLEQDAKTLTDSMTNRERESESIRRGRIDIQTWASRPVAPASDKRTQLAVVGFLGGFALSFGFFFLLGTIDPRAHRSSQLQLDPTLRPLGVVPDMSDAAGDGDARQLASSCVHRLRNKIESKRAAGGSYAIMVTSSFQGDGKTTVAVALAWSYAEAGHSTVLVDCDFIGRALSHQFGALHEEGVRESLRLGAIGERVRSVGKNLSLLPVGVDRMFAANNVQTGILRRMINALKDRFEIVIVDAGPMTASIEAIPVASSCDGAILTIRRGRSRARLGESISEIRETGCNYLGLVLNCADRDDCLRYGSVSKMSAEVARALDGQHTPANPHPLLSPPAVENDGDAGRNA